MGRATCRHQKTGLEEKMQTILVVEDDRDLNQSIGYSLKKSGYGVLGAAVILFISRTDGIKATQGSVFPAGMQAVIAIFGIAWMGDTFINGNITELTGSIEGIVRQMPWLFGLALFVMSILLYSQAATVRAIVPLGIALGISPMMLIALFPAVNGYFFIPNYPTVVAAINFDRTGTTGIGKWILNHSFMMPGMVATIVSIVVGLLLVQVF